MKAFRIVKNEADLSSELIGVESLNSLEVSDLTQNRLDIEVDYLFMKNLFGFSLSEFEIRLFNTHINIYKRILELGEPFGLIMENVKCIKTEISKINEALEALPEDWDVFFPFNGMSKENKHCIGYYLLGHRWGTDVYFISRKGAEKLIRLTQIKIPIDDQILELMRGGKLEVYHDDTGFFERGSDLSYHLDRECSIRDAIFNLDVWNQKDKNAIDKILKKVSEISEEQNLELVLSDGSLLGYIRHGGIMLWDDDVDLGIEECHLNRLLVCLDQHPTLKFKMSLWNGFEYCKIWDEDGEDIPGNDHKFPFVDVWLYRNIRNNIVFNHGTIYPKNKFYPLKKVVFENAVFSAPYCAKDCLDISYIDWRKTIKIFQWCHKFESPFFHPLSLEISVDEYGRLIK